MTPEETASAANTAKIIGYVIGGALLVGMGVITKFSMGSILLFFLFIAHALVGAVELGTDGWIQNITGNILSSEQGKFLFVFTSLVMFALRFCAHFIEKKMGLSPIGILLVCAVLACVGLNLTSASNGFVMALLALTVYGFGKTFFWPTMLGVVSEQTPRGGALTLNAISGIGMLAVGTLGFPYIGTLQADKAIEALSRDEKAIKAVPGLVQDGKLTVVENRSIYEIISYQAISEKKLNALIETLPEGERAAAKRQIDETIGQSKQGALANMILFPVIMLIGYIGLLIYFQLQGGYQQVHLDEGHAIPETAPGAPATSASHPHGITDKPPPTGIKH
jgi:hypothetical protein